MSDILITKKATPSSPSINKVKIYVNTSGNLESVDDTGTVRTYSTGITTEQVQDIVGAMIVDTSSIDVTYDDAGNTISMQVIQTAIDHQNLQNKGTNSHAQIDSHIASTSNPHSVTAAQLNLGNVNNTSDLNKPISTATQTALDGKQPLDTDLSALAGLATTGLLARTGSGTVATRFIAVSTGLGISNPDGVAGNPTMFNADTGSVAVSNHVGLPDPHTQYALETDVSTALSGKENTITPGTTSQYWRGDKTFQNLNKAAVGLPNVDDVSDVNKPISSATQVALNAKYDATNPNNYETPTQLNTRDTNNRARASHTGSQLASTISDFAATVQSTVLTGISFATDAAILATDTILVAMGKLQAQLSGHIGAGGAEHANATTSVAGFMSGADKTKLDGITSSNALKTLSTTANSSNVTFTNVSDLTVNLVAGKTYNIEWTIMYSSNATTTGVVSKLDGTAAFTWFTGEIDCYTTSVINRLVTAITNINQIITAPNTPAVGVLYQLKIRANVLCNTSGTIFPAYRSETNGVNIQVYASSTVKWVEL